MILIYFHCQYQWKLCTTNCVVKDCPLVQCLYRFMSQINHQLTAYKCTLGSSLIINQIMFEKIFNVNKSTQWF